MATADMPDLRNANSCTSESGRVAETGTVTEGDVSTRQQTRREMMTGTSVAEVMGGVATMVLAIIGLAGAAPVYLTAAGVIVLGAGLVLQARLRSGRLFQVISRPSESRFSERDFGGGMTAEFLSGVAGIVLGILSLILVAPWILLPVAAIVFGAMLLVSRGTAIRFGSSSFGSSQQAADGELSRFAAEEMVAGANAAHVLVGIAAVVLGIVGLVSGYPYILTLVALLCLGAFVVATRGAFAGSMSVSVRR